MRFWITKNPRVALLLVPWFVPVSQSRKEIYVALCNRLIVLPDDTFVCLAIDEDRIKGVVIAYCRATNVFLWQARSEGLASSYVDRAFNGLCHWARAKGFNKITTVPNRAAKLWKRRWGFVEQPGSNTLCKEI